MNTYQLDYYVYAYLREDGSPYYIGKGRKYRAWHHSKNDAISPPKDKSRIAFIERNLSDIGALALERRMISWYGRIDLGTGTLRNKTDGGDGVSGRKVSQETIAKAIATKRKTGGIYHCARKESRKKAVATRLQNNNGKFGAHTPDSIARMLATRKANFTPRKPRVVINGSVGWIVTNPTGIQYTTFNLKSFCREHNINSGLLSYNLGKMILENKFSPLKNPISLNTVGWMAEKFNHS